MIAAYRPPATIIEELGITEPTEIDIEAIAEYCGATIVYEPLEGSEARILGGNDHAIITVNESSPWARQRFSAAHELGHWMRDRGKVAFACDERSFIREWGDDNAERRANRYAADLLMPRRVFQPRLIDYGPTFDAVRQLARDFETSVTATAIRVVELGRKPAIVIASERSGRKWFIRADVVPETLWPCERPGSETVAAKLLAGSLANTAVRPVDVPADEWIDHPDASRYTLREDSIVAFNGTVLTLLSWPDDSQLVALQGPDEEPVNELTGELAVSTPLTKRANRPRSRE